MAGLRASFICAMGKRADFFPDYRVWQTGCPPDRQKPEKMPPENDKPSLKDVKKYDALRSKGVSKDDAEHIANASRDDLEDDPPAHAGKTREELCEMARQVGISGCSSMTKAELIESLRNQEK